MNDKTAVILTDYNAYQFYQIAREIEKVFNINNVYCSFSHWWNIPLKTNIRNLVFVGSILKQTCSYLWNFSDETNIIFYGVCEGRPILNYSEKVVFKRKNIKLIVPSEFAKERLEEIDIPVETVIPHAIDMENKAINTEFEQQIKKLFNFKKMLLNVSDNNARKGLDKLLVSYKVLEKIFSDSFLILHTQAGVGYGGINIQKYIKILGLKRIWWTQMAGLLSEAKMNALYKNAYLYACSSYAEGFCLPLIEAFKYNVPIVAVDCKPFNEIVENRKTGLLIPYTEIRRFEIKRLMDAFMHLYDVDDFIDACTLLLIDEKKRNRMSEEIEKVKWKWHSATVYKKFIDYLE